MEEKEIDHEMVNEKARQIGEVIDGCRLKEVFYILGCVTVEIVVNAHEQGVDAKDAVVDWLRTLITNIRSIKFTRKDEERGN